MCLALKDLVKQHPDIRVVYPVHLNPNVRSTVNALLQNTDRIHLTEPLDYITFVSLLRRCFLVLTDSGGIQEEAPTFGKPVLVLRKLTERPEASQFGMAKIIGMSREWNRQRDQPPAQRCGGVSGHVGGRESLRRWSQFGADRGGRRPLVSEEDSAAGGRQAIQAARRRPQPRRRKTDVEESAAQGRHGRQGVTAKNCVRLWLRAMIYVLYIIVFVICVYTGRHYWFTLNRLFGFQRHPYIDIDTADWPPVTVLVAAHNEEKVIANILERA